MAAPEVELPWTAATAPTTVASLAARALAWAATVITAITWLYARVAEAAARLGELTETVGELNETVNSFEATMDATLEEAKTEFRDEITKLKAEVAELKRGPGTRPLLPPSPPPAGIAADPASVSADLRAALKLPGEASNWRVPAVGGRLDLDALSKLTRGVNVFRDTHDNMLPRNLGDCFAGDARDHLIAHAMSRDMGGGEMGKAPVDAIDWWAAIVSYVTVFGIEVKAAMATVGSMVVPGTIESDILSQDMLQASWAGTRREVELALGMCSARSLASATARVHVWRKFINSVSSEMRQEMLELADLNVSDAPPADFTVDSMFMLGRKAIAQVWARNVQLSKVRIAFPGCDKAGKNPDTAPAKDKSAADKPAADSPSKKYVRGSGGSGGGGKPPAAGSGRTSGCGMCRANTGAVHSRDNCPTHILKTKCTFSGCPGNGTGGCKKIHDNGPPSQTPAAKPAPQAGAGRASN
jgi:hypothetical protein